VICRKSNFSNSTKANICALIMAVLLPPVGVAMVSGCGMKVCINILLCLLGYIPGKQINNSVGIGRSMPRAPGNVARLKLVAKPGCHIV
jgi:uncharacterized membrane protein YqaE (UPF0057 family)